MPEARQQLTKDLLAVYLPLAPLLIQTVVVAVVVLALLVLTQGQGLGATVVPVLPHRLQVLALLAPVAARELGTTARMV